MASRLKKSMILISARMIGLLVLMLSPIILVRFLEIEAYGQYREFVLFSMTLITVFKFSIPNNLNYFIPKHPEKAAKLMTQTVILLLAASIFGLVLFLLIKNLFITDITYAYVLLLILYVVFYINLDIVENYWIGTQQPQYILIYSTVRSIIRVGGVVIAAFVTGDIEIILLTMVSIEGIKVLLLLAWMLYYRLLALRIDTNLLREQSAYIVPLGLAAIVFFMNQRMGQYFVTGMLGASALAIYTVGVYQVPIISVIRSSVADILFPDIVKSVSRGGQEGLDLWRKATLYYLFFIVPIAIVLFYSAELFITVLFTEKFIGAVGVFKISLIIMLRQCFDMGTPLRAMNVNKYFLRANILALFISLPLAALLIIKMGLEGAALTWLICEILVAWYLARKMLAVYNISFSEFALWNKIGKIVIGSVLALPLLFIDKLFLNNEIMGALLASTVYASVYLWIICRMGIPEVDNLLSRLNNPLLKLFIRH